MVKAAVSLARLAVFHSPQRRSSSALPGAFWGVSECRPCWRVLRLFRCRAIVRSVGIRLVDRRRRWRFQLRKGVSMGIVARRSLGVGLCVAGLCAVLIFASRAPASSSMVPSIAGTWTVMNPSPPCVQGCSGTWQFVQTGPDLYSMSNGVGWTTTNVPISGNSMTATMHLWECGEGGTFSQADESACPSTSGHCSDDLQFTFPKTGLRR